MSRQIALIALVLAFCVALCSADTFKHRQSGEVFHGFVTQKQNREKTLVYVEKDKSFKPLSLAEYEVTRDDKGRRNRIVVIPIRYEEAIISRSVAQTIAKTIVDASNKGPRYILLEIDSPGGRGDYMKMISTAITGTTNCPVIAYISGGPYGGAYSAAATVAMACEKIYIAGDAVMGSVAPVMGRSLAAGNVTEYYELFSSDNLAGYGSYIAALAANRQRPPALAMALLDKSMEIVEVEDPDGNRKFINKTDRNPQEAVVRTVSKTEAHSITEETESGTTTRNVMKMVLTIGATEAMRAGMADKVVGSRQEVFADLGAADAGVTYTRSIEKAVKKYVAIKRNVDKSIAQIDFLQQRVNVLRGQLDLADEQVRTNPTTRQQRRSDGGYDPYDNYGIGGERYYRGTGRRSRNSRRSRSRGDDIRGSESVTVFEPSGQMFQLVRELGMTLTDLIGEHRRLMGLVRRDPGALPTSLTMDGLQRRLNEAAALQRNLAIRFR